MDGAEGVNPFVCRYKEAVRQGVADDGGVGGGEGAEGEEGFLRNWRVVNIGGGGGGRVMEMYGGSRRDGGSRLWRAVC